MFESLQPPGDLESARTRLRTMIDEQSDGRRPGSAPARELSLAASVGRCPELGGGEDGWPAIDPSARVVVADSVLWRAGPDRLLALSDAMGRDQILVFLEPTAELGWRRAVHVLGRPLWRRLAGHDFECDVPAALREAGLQVTELTRFGIGPGRMRSYALGQAEHIR